MRHLWFVLLLAGLIPVALTAQNPLFRPPSGEDSEQTEEFPGVQGGLFDRPAARLVLEWSNTLQRSIAGLSRRVREEGDLPAGLAAFGVAVLFGMVHIAGPGHGKIFALSYFSSRKSKPSAGILYSAVVNTVDSVAAFVLVLLGYVMLRAVAPAFRTQAPIILEVVSYSLIVAFGVAHLISHLKPHSHDRDDHDSEAADGSNHPEAANKSMVHDARNPWVLAVTVGLIPCPVSTVLLVYGVVNDVLPFMVLMVVGVSTGGFLAMTAIALTIIAGRKRLMELLSHGTGATVATVLEFVASGSIILVGVLLLLAALG
ncbi:MAG: nickel/cobalt transporter [Spirochaetales bacterium]